MNKFLVLGIFAAASAVFLRRGRIYIVPLILLIYSNLNGLLDGEDFAFQGLVKFQDYGLILSVVLIFDEWWRRRNSRVPGGGAGATWLYKAVLIYWAYYCFEFAYSILLQQDLEWPLKMGRYFFYGLIFFVAYAQLRPNPILRFKLLIENLQFWTLLFGVLYVAYNVFGLDIYPKPAFEEFAQLGLDSVRRNFAGLPVFTGYFIILFTSNLMEGRGRLSLNVGGLLLLTLCQFLSLTRGFVLLTAGIVLLTALFRPLTVSAIPRLILLVGALAFSMTGLTLVAPEYMEAIGARFQEFADMGGATNSTNYVARLDEFFRIVTNVYDFNPLLGFGFTNMSLLGLGYTSSVLHAGSADNGFSNLIGTTGFLGLTLFLLIVLLWIVVNVRLQILGGEQYAKINFLFIVYMLGSFFNGSGMSYMHAYAIFIAYDMLAYSYFLRIRAARRHSQSMLQSCRFA